MKTFTATFSGGHTATRTSEADYTHASRDSHGVARFHKTRRAARAAAGAFGEVVIIDGGTAGSCRVCEGKGSFKNGPSATDGTFITVTCHRCCGTGRIDDGS